MVSTDDLSRTRAASAGAKGEQSWAGWAAAALAALEGKSYALEDPLDPELVDLRDGRLLRDPQRIAAGVPKLHVQAA